MSVLEQSRPVVDDGYESGACPPKPLPISTGPPLGARSNTTPVTVADLMTDAHVSDPDAPVPEIIHRVLDLGQREIVVVSGGRPDGVITPSRLALLADPAASGSYRYARDLLPERSSRLLPGQDLFRAAVIMSAHETEALPVVDHRGALIGVLAHRQMIDHLAQVGAG